jgi:hypothetical protein
VRICGELAAGRDSWGRFASWPEPNRFGRNRNPAGMRRNLEESGGRKGIPVPQEFLQKFPVKVAENRNSKGCNFVRPI